MEIFYDEFILKSLPNAYYNEIVKHINQLSKSYNVNDFDVNDFNSYNEYIMPYSFRLSLDNINICLIECDFCVSAKMIEDEKLNVKYIDSINIEYCNITSIEYMSCDDYQKIITNSLPKDNPIIKE